VVLASAPKKVTDKLQRVLNTAVRLITGTQKHECGLSWLLHDDLRRLAIPQQVQYKLAVTVNRCLRYRAPKYLTDCCVPVFEVSGRQRLRSASRRKLNISRFVCSTFGSRAFSVAGPTVWNLLPHLLCDPTVESETFLAGLENTYLCPTLTHERIRGCFT